jgi:hypothetical protein
VSYDLTIDFVGLHDRHIGEVFLWYQTEEKADSDLQAILSDEPRWQGKVEVVTVRLGGDERIGLN